jgi:hypothetical protein
VAAIRAALTRMAEGTYRICRTCEEPIVPQGLTALTYATQCMACATQAAMREGGARLLQPLQHPLMTRAIASAVVGPTGFIQAPLLLGPLCGEGQPHVHQGRTLARHVAQGERHLTVGDCAQPTAPLPGPPPKNLTGCRTDTVSIH